MERKRSGFQEIAAEGLMSLSELREKLARLDEEREAAHGELEALRARRGRLEALERDAEALLSAYAGKVPEELDRLSPEERQRVYKMMRLHVSARTDGRTEVSGLVLQDGEDFCVEDTTSVVRSSTRLPSRRPPTLPPVAR